MHAYVNASTYCTRPRPASSSLEGWRSAIAAGKGEAARANQGVGGRTISLRCCTEKASRFTSKVCTSAFASREHDVGSPLRNALDASSSRVTAPSPFATYDSLARRCTHGCSVALHARHPRTGACPTSRYRPLTFHSKAFGDPFLRGLGINAVTRSVREVADGAF